MSQPAPAGPQVPDGPNAVAVAPPGHVVTRPTPPFVIADTTLVVHQVPAATDNLVWVLVSPETATAAVVDGPDAEGALALCAALGVRLTTVINTHTHPDHIGVNRDLARRGLLSELRVIGNARSPVPIPGLNEAVGDGDTVQFAGLSGRVIATPGHQDGHLSFHFGDALFCGDTLFCGGCGYLFDGPPEAMHRSLARLAALPEDTRICCAHEYTQDNLLFAYSVEPDNAALLDRMATVWAKRAEGESTVPSTLREETATNPFLRTQSASIVDHLRAAMPNAPLDTPERVFTAARALKDRRVYKSLVPPNMAK